MSIRVSCPNGHVLEVKGALAGKSGLCPVCRAPVRVPQPHKADEFEDAILDMLGPGPAKASAGEPAASGIHRIDGGTDGAEAAANGPPKKTCFRCHREIDLVAHICPHCHTYIASLADFR